MITLLFKLLCVVVGLNYKLQNGRKIGLSLESYDHSARVYRYTLEGTSMHASRANPRS